LSGSIVKSEDKISANTGLQPCQTMPLVVATYEKGVVITSPEISAAFIAINKAVVPLFKKKNA